MSIALLAAAALLLAAAALGACACVLLVPLRAVLLELCGERRRAEFWTHMVATCMVAGTVVAALMGVLVAPSQPVLAAAALLRWTLLGTAGGLLVVAAVVAAMARRPACPPANGSGRPWSAEP